MAKDMTWKEAIIKVLRQSGEAMDYKEIADQVSALGLRKSLGATPASTVNATIVMSIRDQGEKSPFVKVGRGTFMLREPGKEPARLKAPATPDEEDGAQYDIITSFGMFWRKDLVQWQRTPRILGIQQLGAEPVDFYRQQGIYLLYDGREIIYVGRATDRPLGLRLYEHTLDRLAARWDRFSWFGVLPVSPKGGLNARPAQYQSDRLIPALEALLIEALEPRQNRKRGDDLSAVEYLQEEEDPELKKQKEARTLQELLRRAGMPST